MISISYDQNNIGNARAYSRGFMPVNFGGDLEALARGISRFCWSPSRFADGGWRREKSWREAAYLVLDFDDGETTLKQAKRKFADCKHIIGTTRSHQKPKGDLPPCDRFRVVIPFDRLITDLAEFKASMRYWVKRFGSDPSCVDGARLYWPCDIVQVCSEGETAEVIPAKKHTTRDWSEYRSRKMIPRFVEGYLRMGIPCGNRNNLCNKIAFYLAQCGFSVEEIVSLIINSPTSRVGFSDEEMARAIASGHKAGSQKGGVSA